MTCNHSAVAGPPGGLWNSATFRCGKSTPQPKWAASYSSVAGR